MNKKKTSLAFYGWLSILAAISTIVLKSYAYWLTDSVGLLSDAMESLINLVAAIIVLITLNIATLPPDANHAYGHEKVEYFSSGAEGIMILFAAFSIGFTAWQRLLYPQPIHQLDMGVAISIVAALINLVVAWVLIKAGKRYCSITLEADGKHLMTDVWTTVGVIFGIALIRLAEWLGYSGWEMLDPIIAILVALNIMWTGTRLIQRTVAGLMDEALSDDEQTHIISILDAFVHEQGIEYHALRTRYAGARQFMSVHILVPGVWTVQQGHDLLEQIEATISSHFKNIDIDTHLEPLEDKNSWLH